MRKIGYLLLTLALAAGLLISGCSKAPSVEPAGDKVTFEGKTLNLYVAAGMQKPMDEIIQSFKEQTKANVAVNYGPSGGLFAQIEQGQPCDLYYSADWIYIDKLEQSDKVEKSEKFLNDNIVLITSKTGKDKVAKMEDLAKSGVTLVIADPQAPVGAYSKKGLEGLGLWDKVSPNIKALPTTVNQVAIMVKEDQLDAGLVYSSTAKANDMEAVDTIDTKDTGEIVFGLAVIKGGETELAKAFAQHSQTNVATFVKYGWRAYE